MYVSKGQYIKNTRATLLRWRLGMKQPEKASLRDGHLSGDPEDEQKLYSKAFRSNSKQ